jgi:hypothetical protein
MEVQVIISIASFSEIMHFDYFHDYLSFYKIASTGIAFLWIIIFGLNILFCFLQLLKTKGNDKLENQKYFVEFFNGVKPKFAPRAYSLLFLTKRFLMCLICLILRDLPVMLKGALICGLQVLDTIYFICVRPFDHPKDNLVEIYNQIILCFVILGF